MSLGGVLAGLSSQESATAADGTPTARFPGTLEAGTWVLQKALRVLPWHREWAVTKGRAPGGRLQAEKLVSLSRGNGSH